MNEDSKVQSILSAEEKLELKKHLRVMAYNFGIPKDHIKKELGEIYDGEALKFAIAELELLLPGINRANRKLIRKNRAVDGLTFSKVVKNKLK
jgi:hypothetical protein